VKGRGFFASLSMTFFDSRIIGFPNSLAKSSRKNRLIFLTKAIILRKSRYVKGVKG